ncbi:alpha-D-mannose-specific lectin [Obba rivulosa]|uniref:Alpha-D-mannose-specific lectin n=1 Tax=Obba rivulosa TaxID=1052685 RepID=A0A8E2DHL2_9APHY|nr:alpha-D-mannose-specific lectin [Obba rivulosa]
MASNIEFTGGHVFNNREYPSAVMKQSIPIVKKMGANVDIRYATVDVDAAKRDLASAGCDLRLSSSVDMMESIDPALIRQRIEDMVQNLFEESIEIKNGFDVILYLVQAAIEGSFSESDEHFFWSSSRSEGTYSSYQLTFYSMRKASFCFIVFSVIAFKEQKVIFGIPSKFRSGISYNAQVFEVGKVYSNVLYNFGILHGGRALGSPNGQHMASLSVDGNLSVDEQWQSGSGGKGVPPHYLAMQDDANLVIYDKNNSPTWASGSRPGRFSEGPYRVEMQDDGNLVVYDKFDTALWSYRW